MFNGTHENSTFIKPSGTRSNPNATVSFPRAKGARMLEEPFKIVMLAESKALKQQIKKVAVKEEFQFDVESSFEQLHKRLTHEQYDIVVVTSKVVKKNQQAHSVEKILTDFALQSSHAQTILLIEPEDIELAGIALKMYPVHYAKLPISDEELRILFENSISIIEEQQLKDFDTSRGSNDRMGEIIGRSAPMQKVYQHVRRAASTDISVMLVGETGTGKDLAAQAIHLLSKRNKYPYVPVNLGSLPNELIASELFGHEKGAFTGAISRHHGKFEQAQNGTLFLDEIDAIDEKVQVSLLRVLEQKRFNRLGSSTPVESNARLIVATNTDLHELVKRGRFRKDLFYRLDVFRIEMPLLAERYGDIHMLINEFIARFASELKVPVKGVSQEVLQALENYDWPGNIRELKNVIHRAVLMCDDSKIQLEHLPPRFSAHADKQPTVSFEVGTTLDTVERTMILRALELTDNNRKEAAGLLGISRRAIYNKLKKHNIE